VTRPDAIRRAILCEQLFRVLLCLIGRVTLTQWDHSFFLGTGTLNKVWCLSCVGQLLYTT